MIYLKYCDVDKISWFYIPVIIDDTISGIIIIFSIRMYISPNIPINRNTFKLEWTTYIKTQPDKIRHKNKTILQFTFKRKDIKEERENTKSNQNP
jgi:hypothetical protein